MASMRLTISIILLAFLLFAAPTQLWGWGNTGHEAVAYVAWQQMTPAARARALELLKRVPALDNPMHTKTVPGYDAWVADLPSGLSKDDQNLYLFMRAATWADTIKHVGFKDSDTPPPGVTTDVNIGFTDTASHGYWHFIDTAFASDHSTVPDTPVPNAATQIVALRTAIASGEAADLEAYDLIWLEHLVGDIHQPLHGTTRYFASIGDEGGNTVKIRLPASMKKAFEGTLSKDYPTELHAFWDDLPGEGDPGPALPQAAKFARPLPDADAAKATDTDPSDWAAESFSLAKKDAYKGPIGKSPTPTASTSAAKSTSTSTPGKTTIAKTTTSSSYLITQTYYNRALQDAKDRVALAGARLAKLLNENLK
jgi:S1/P1 Nuclease